MWLFLAYSIFGLLIGNLVGLTSDKVTNSLISLVFTFAGSTALILSQKMKDDIKIQINKAISYFALFCIIGVYTGIIVSEYQLLTPEEIKKIRQENKEVSRASNTYLQGIPVETINLIDIQVQNKELTYEQGYEKLYNIITNKK